MEQMGLGWKNTFHDGVGRSTITSGLEVIWTDTPVQWSMKYLENLHTYEWELYTSPAGAWQWRPEKGGGRNAVPDPEDGQLTRHPSMLTTDIAFKVDPVHERITRDYLANPSTFADAFARAWFTLTHRDMGPIDRYLGPLVPQEELLWQDRVPAVDHELVDADDVATLKARVLDSGLTVSQLKSVQQAFDGAQSGARKISLADLIVLGGCAGVEKAAKDAGVAVTVPFTPGRTDATQEMTVLVGGLRVLGTSWDGSSEGVLTDRPGQLSNDFFVNLLDMDTTWTSTSRDESRFEGRNAAGDVVGTGTRADLVLGSSSELRAVSEVYASSDGGEKFVADFVAAWDKVMMLDRYDVG